MKVVVFGSTGMVGQGVLREALADEGVSKVVTVVRAPTGTSHPKLEEIVHANFEDFSSLRLDADACFYCLGVTSAGMNEADYTRITHDYTLAAAKALVSPRMTFIFVSGAGADGSAMWARVKKRTELDLADMPFKAVYVFRPGAIQPLDGIRSRTKLYNAIYPVLLPMMLATKTFAPSFITDTRRVGRAMLEVARHGYAKKILGNRDINVVANAS